MENNTTSPTMTTQDWDALEELAADPFAEIGEDCLATLRRKHFVDKRNTHVTKYGRERLARERGRQSTTNEVTKTVSAPARERGVSKKGLEIARTKGYSIRKISGEWHIIDRFGQNIQGSGTFTNSRDAQKKADELNDARNAQVLAAA